MIEMMKRLHKHYASPTPAKWRKIGDSLLVVSTSVTTLSVVSHQNTIAIIALVTGVLGKFLTNLFKEDEK